MTDNRQDAGGRPTKKTPELVDRLLVALADGLNKTQACRAVGIGVSTLADWVNRFPELTGQVEQAREQARQKALAGIKSAGQSGDWRAWESFLKHSFPADYRQTGAKIDISATATGQQANIVCTPEEREELIAQRERLVADPKTSLQAHHVSSDVPKADTDRRASAHVSKLEEDIPVPLLEPLGPDDGLNKVMDTGDAQRRRRCRFDDSVV